MQNMSWKEFQSLYVGKTYRGKILDKRATVHVIDVSLGGDPEIELTYCRSRSTYSWIQARFLSFIAEESTRRVVNGKLVKVYLPLGINGPVTNVKPDSVLFDKSPKMVTWEHTRILFSRMMKILVHEVNLTTDCHINNANGRNYCEEHLYDLARSSDGKTCIEEEKKLVLSELMSILGVSK